MSMNMKNNESEDIVAEINMTPLIDVMLVLLIIFMVTSTAALESGLDVDLPKTSTTSEAKSPEVVVVSLNSQDQVAVSGKIVTFAELQNEIAAQLKKLNSESVIFEGDSRSQLGRAVEIMDIAKSAGATSFSIAAEKLEKK